MFPGKSCQPTVIKGTEEEVESGAKESTGQDRDGNMGSPEQADCDITELLGPRHGQSLKCRGMDAHGVLREADCVAQ